MDRIKLHIAAALQWHFARLPARAGPSPFVATALFATFASSFPIALYILGCGILGITAAALLPTITNKDISVEYKLL